MPLAELVNGRMIAAIDRIASANVVEPHEIFLTDVPTLCRSMTGVLSCPAIRPTDVARLMSVVADWCDAPATSEAQIRRKTVLLTSLRQSVFACNRTLPFKEYSAAAQSALRAAKQSILAEQPFIRDAAQALVATLCRVTKEADEGSRSKEAKSALFVLTADLLRDVRLSEAADDASMLADLWSKRATSALTLAAVVLSFPNDVPSFAPLALIRISKLVLRAEVQTAGHADPTATAEAGEGALRASRARSAMSRGGRQALLRWWSTHRDEWEYRHKASFSEAQIDNLMPFFLSQSYYV